MNTLDDLRRTLADHTPDDGDLAARPAAVARRVQSVRRRRAAVAALAAVAVVGGGAVAAVVRPAGDDSAPRPADRRTTTAPTAREQVTFRPEAGGYRLHSSALADPGDRRIDLSTVLPSDVQFAVHCTSSGKVGSGARMPWVTVDVLGWQVVQVSCGTGGSPYDDPAAYLYGPDATSDGGFTGHRTTADGTVRDRHFAPDTNISFTVRLTDQDGRPYERPISDVELGIGIYGRS